jgi:GT2 family glycosyltransferase
VKSSGCDFAVLLHNDVRPAHGWLDRFVQDIEHVEGVYGKGSTIVSPRHVPYYYLDPPPSIVKSPTFWAYLKATHIPSVEKMAAYCLEHGLLFDGDKVTCIPWQPPANTGHQLMMWIARPEFFDAVGLCDEEMRGINFDDSDWGIRALLANKRNLQSCTALIGHVEGLTFFNPKYTQAPVDNAQVFIKKWGREMFDEMQTGTLWVRLHKEQDERRR